MLLCDILVVHDRKKRCNIAKVNFGLMHASFLVDFGFSIKDLSLYRDARTIVIVHAVVQNFVTAYTNTNNIYSMLHMRK